MADRDPRQQEQQTPANQTGEDEGTIKRQQQTGEKDVARGSEPERHARK